MSGTEPGDTTALLARAERLVERAASRDPSPVEFYLESGSAISAEIEKGAIATAATGLGSGGGVRVVREGKMGFAYFTTDEEAMAAHESALRNTRWTTVDGYRLPPARPIPSHRPTWDGEVANSGVARVVRLASELLDGARERSREVLVSGGGVGLEWSMAALASSEGLACSQRSTQAGASASVVLQEGGAAISTGDSATSFRLDVDAVAVGASAADKALRLRRPREAGGGRRDVILHPEAAAELLVEWMVGAATGDEAMRGKTLWSGRLGQVVAHPAASLFDDPRHPDAVEAVAFDGEGLPTARLPIVDGGGVLCQYLFDSWDAHRHAQASTASAVRSGFKSRPTTGTHNLVFGSPAHAMDVDRLVGGIDDGLVVESVLGAHTANATTGEFSVTAPNVWAVRKGAIEHAVREVAMAGSLAELLLRTDATSTQAKSMDGLRMPNVRIRGVDVSV